MRILKRNRPTIGILAGWLTFPGTIHSFIDNVYRGIRTAAYNFDCNLLIGGGVGSPFSDRISTVMPISILPEIAFTPVGPWNTDGLIILGPLNNPSLDIYFQGLIDSGFPIVFAGDRETGPSVVVDNENGIAQAVDHLVEHGHSSIAMVSGIDNHHGDSAARLRGFQAALSRHKLTYDPELVLPGFHASDMSSQAMKKMLQTGKNFSAVIASNDDSAVGVMDAIYSYGLVVPNDIAVIGFDDRLEARANNPLLTSVHFPMFELGYHSLELLIQIIQGLARPDSILRIPTHLVVRESCGCLPGEIPSGNKFRQTSRRSPGVNQNNGLRERPYQSFSSHYQFYSQPRVNHIIVGEMADAVHKEMLCLTHTEVEYLCSRLLDAFITSLENGDAAAFRQAIQHILEHVLSLDDDIYSWQGAISVLREWTPGLIKNLPNSLQVNQAENLLHQARISINETLRGQYSRKTVRDSARSTLINQMTSRFFAASSEEELFEVLANDLPSLGIQNVSVVLFQSEGEDPYARSLVKIPTVLDSSSPSFFTKDFPPPGLFPEDKSFQLVVLPIFGPEGVVGQAAFQADDISFFGIIVRQLAAAMRSVNLYQEAVEARHLAEEANTQKSRFLSIVSHELRTPLNLIIGLSNMMLQENIEPDNPEFMINRKDLERVYIGAQHLESLIRDVLDLAQNDLRQLKLSLDYFDLREILLPVAQIGQQLAQDKELAWITNIENCPLTIHGDRSRLRQVILNLINNAVKFTMHGSITLSAGRRDGHISISVSDTGLGIPHAELDMIFNEFQQSTRTSSRGFGGLGLGLAICKNLIELHGGKIKVDSKEVEGSGSTFSIDLPAQTEFELAEIAISQISQADQLLLLVKNPVEADRLKEYLLEHGYQVALCVVGADFDWSTNIANNPPDKIVLDVSITAEQGWEIIRFLKDNPATREIPILFFSIDSTKNKGSFLDFNYLNKPVAMDNLAAAVLQNLNQTGVRGRCRKILIVDDDEQVLDMHARMLDSMAYDSTILKAKNGREALEIIRSTPLSLILLDLMMPEMDGFALLEAMRSENLDNNIPIIILSSQALTHEDLVRLSTGVVSVLNKGIFSAQETISQIETTLSRRRKPSSETRRIVMKAIAYIHTCFSETITRSDIANHVNLSERHLTRCFNQELGLTPMTYLNRFRVHQAKKLLVAGIKGITDIALEVGFSNSGYFTRVFKDEVGMSPREYSQSQSTE